MNDKTLYFCRTPLQAIIINNLLESRSGNHHVIYRPNNKSKKHEYYFNQLRTTHKTFISFQPVSFSHSLSSIVEWLSLPTKIRQIKYNNLFIASIGDMVFSFFAARNKIANIYLFDDGVFNLKQEEWVKWISADSISNKIVRKIFRGEDKIFTQSRIAHHFTLYPAELCWLDCGTTQLNDLFAPNRVDLLHGAIEAKKIRVLLGSAYIKGEVDDDVKLLLNRNIRHEKIIHSQQFDLYIPHPAHSSQPVYSRILDEFFTKYPIDLMIAEDIIAALRKSGFSPIIYGFISSALVNLSKDFKTVSIVLDEQMMLEAEIQKQLGAKIIKVF
jgi:hypothetical protein